MPDDLRQEEDGPPRDLGEIVAEAVLECFPDSLAIIPIIPVLWMFGSGILFFYLIGSGLYHLAFDPNAVNVAARLDALSIDPGKWIGRG